jgi:hypothetical protein
MTEKIVLCSMSIEELAKALISLITQKSEVNNSSTDEELLSRTDACKLLSINKTTLWKHTKSGKLKSYGIGNRVYYKKHELLSSIIPIN